jgi:uncharacterized integral membrane protein (TIGR00697 family)
MPVELIILSALCLLSVLAVAKIGKEWLYTTIIVNLFLVSIFGAKLITIGAFTTNVGNIFYAGVFFATYLLIEHYGVAAARTSIYLGLFGLASLVITTPFVLLLTDPAILPLRGGLEVISRIAVASLFAFLLAQQLNVWLYTRLQEAYPEKIWLRGAVAIVAAQFVDSVLFFWIAFGETIPSAVVFDTMLGGFLLKVFIGFLSIPLIYWSVTVKDFPTWEQLNTRLSTGSTD